MCVEDLGELENDGRAAAVMYLMFVLCGAGLVRRQEAEPARRPATAPASRGRGGHVLLAPDARLSGIRVPPSPIPADLGRFRARSAGRILFVDGGAARG